MRSKVLMVLELTGAACGESKESLDPGASAAGQRRWGPPIELGNGEARTYVVMDQQSGDPVEVGVALREDALEGLPPAEAAVPKMGLHWIDTDSPELPPSNRPFTATFIIGSWGGKVIFDEPMVTRDFILAHRDGLTGATRIPVPASGRYVPAGFYMDSYRVSFDRTAGEYRSP